MAGHPEYDAVRSLSVVTSAPAMYSRGEWVSWRTVARMLVRGRRWIYARCRDGSFEAKRCGNAWRIRRSSVEAWLGTPTA